MQAREYVATHLEHKDRQRRRAREQDAALERADLLGPRLGLLIAAVVVRHRAGRIASVTDCSFQRLGVDHAGDVAHLRLFSGQIHVGFQHTGHGRQGFLDTADAGRAAHTFNGQLDRLLDDRITGLLNRGLDRGRVGRG